MSEERPRLLLRDLANWAGFFTVARLPVALAYPFFAGDRRLALGLYLLGVSTDVVDGIIARRTGTTTYTGAMVDGWMDKALHASVALSMVGYGIIPAWWLLPWFAREWVQLVLVAIFIRAYLRGEFRPRGANRWGKFTTIALAAALVAALLDLGSLAFGLTLLTGALGLVTSGTYLVHTLEDRRPAR